MPKLISECCPIAPRRRLAEAISELNYEACLGLGINIQTAQKCKRGILPNFRTRSMQRLIPLLLK